MAMRRNILVALLFILFIIEGTIIPWLVPDAWQTRIVPHLVYIVILFVAVYGHRHTALVLGLIFGMIHDVVFYGQIIGTYSFAMGLSSYLMGLIFQAPRAPLPVMMTVVLLGSLLFDGILHALYTLFHLTDESFDFAFVDHMLPNLVIHFVFALVIYVPLRRQLEMLYRRRRASREDKA
ncbi:rod shape-determining protein MreD [Paenibacillus sediminis]|uniref:Rod shape-determining protein MreD n=1 Tax=Paenibacillus sediminis TaxID=664909 RepID=A0ABS4H757_9BACL|nr:rod shape-determining protein MreD [Paenibacillus sediminis]MBP1938321.1 rod shape-determining protein MreD [Paenibacillus sediminis]